MKKRFSLILMLILIITCFVMCFTGCDAIDKIKGVINGESSFNNEEEPVKACEHTYVDTDWVSDGTNHWHVCTKCGEKIESSIASHTFGSPQIYELPTCTTDGRKKYTCTICEYNYFDVISSSTAHNWVDGAITETPTCTETGTQDQECSLCHAHQIKTLDKLPHTVGAWLHDSDNHWHYCSECSQNVDLEAHDYEETVIIAAGCETTGKSKFTCKDCGYEYTDNAVAALGHDYKSEVVSPATCSSTGIRRYTCKRDGCTSTFDETIPIGDAHDYDEEIITSATCYASGQKRLTCKKCSHEELVVIPQLTHDYQGYVCIYCHRDKFLDYQADFNSKGNSKDSLIQIDSEEEMIAFFDYLLFKESASAKYVKVNYTTVTKANLSSFTNAVSNKSTASTWTIGMSYPDISGELTYISYKLTEDKASLSEKASLGISDSYYPDVRYPQQQSLQLGAYANTRANDYSTFKYLSRINELSVSSSDQLYWAFEHGYKPVPVASSPAETILEMAKEVCRDVISDTMTDAEKVAAFYQWFIKEIQYDQGAFANSNSITTVKFKAWYAEGVFMDKTSVCDGMSKAFCILTGIEDIQSIRIVSNDHAWNKVYVDIDGDGDKEWSGVDVTWGNLALNKSMEVLSLDDLFFTDAFKVGEGETAINYVGAGCDSTEAYNIFKYLHYGSSTPSTSNDYVISSQSELNALISYYKTQYTSKTTDYYSVNIFITTSFCATQIAAAGEKGNASGSAIDVALKNASISGSYFFTYQRTITLEGTEGMIYNFMK